MNDLLIPLQQKGVIALSRENLLLARIFQLVFLVLCFAFTGFAAGDEATQPLETKAETPSPVAPSDQATKPIRIVLEGHPEIRSLGFCVAEQKGYFLEEGLTDLDLRWDFDSANKLERLANGEFELLVSSMAEGICARADGQPIVAVNLLSETGTACIMVRNDLDPALTRIHGLNEKTVAIWFNNEKMVRALFAALDIQVKFVVQREESNLLFNDGLTLASFGRFETNSLQTQFKSFRDDVRLFFFKDLELDYPETTIFCRESFLKENADSCQKIVHAMYRGWETALQQPREAIKILKEYCQKYDHPCDEFIGESQLKRWLASFKLKQPLTSNGNCPQESYEKLVSGLVLAREFDPDAAPAYDQFFFNVLNENDRARIQRIQPEQQEPEQPPEANDPGEGDLNE
ncbi:MAG: ABC transporter substrate-binding protein [Planctomycetia bacterium]|nr:ABC transporter substrate-binding protein [Planctomycetia bacterium]